MTDIAAGNLTYTINYNKVNPPIRFVVASIAYGDAALTYPSGGIPLTTAKLGFKQAIEALIILESNGDALLYEWDRSANKIRTFYPTQETGAATNKAGVEFTAATTAPAATTLVVLAIGY